LESGGSARAWSCLLSRSADRYATSNPGRFTIDTIKIAQDIDHHRRCFLGAAAASIAAAQLGLIRPLHAEPGKPTLPAVKPGTNTSLGPLKQIDAGVLNVGYAEAGPAGGPPVILLHGWPYDINAFVDVAPLLASAGY